MTSRNWGRICETIRVTGPQRPNQHISTTTLGTPHRVLFPESESHTTTNTELFLNWLELKSEPFEPQFLLPTDSRPLLDHQS